MSKKQVKKRIETYSTISKRNNVRIFKFQVLYDVADGMYLIYLKYTIEEDGKITEHEEIEAYDGKGWIKISNNFTAKDFVLVFNEAQNVNYKFPTIKHIILKSDSR